MDVSKGKNQSTHMRNIPVRIPGYS